MLAPQIELTAHGFYPATTSNGLTIPRRMQETANKGVRQPSIANDVTAESLTNMRTVNALKTLTLGNLQGSTYGRARAPWQAAATSQLQPGWQIVMSHRISDLFVLLRAFARASAPRGQRV